MLAVPLFNMQGKRTGSVEIDPAVLGGHVRPGLIKQAIVAYLDHQRRDSARTKSRSDVVGSTRKLYRQKGTGRARAGASRTPVRRGGGRTFAKRIARSTKVFPKKMRRLARDSAILAKIEAQDVLILEELNCPEPKTRVFVEMLTALGVEKGCLVAMHEPNREAYLSGRNVPKTDLCLVEQLCAYEVLSRDKLIFTKTAFDGLVARSSAAKPAKPAGDGE